MSSSVVLEVYFYNKFEIDSPDKLKNLFIDNLNQNPLSPYHQNQNYQRVLRLLSVAVPEKFLLLAGYRN